MPVQAWIFLFRNCTFPNHNPEMRLLFQIFFIIILVTKSHDKQTTYICMYGIYSQLVFRPFTPKRFWKTRLIFINCLKACNCCTLMDICACIYFKNIFSRLYGSLGQRFVLPKTSFWVEADLFYLFFTFQAYSGVLVIWEPLTKSTMWPSPRPWVAASTPFWSTQLIRPKNPLSTSKKAALAEAISQLLTKHSDTNIM